MVSSYRGTRSKNRTSIRLEKKFSEDILRQSYQYYADLFGESKKTVKLAMDRLEQLTVIKRHFRTVTFGEGLVSNNVMYVELIPNILYCLTFPEKIPSMEGMNIPYEEGDDDKMGGSLPTKSDTPMEILGGRGIRSGTQVSQISDTGHAESGSRLSPGRDTGLLQNGVTKSDGITNTSGKDSYPNYLSDKTRNQAEAIEDMNACCEMIKQNIEYDHHMQYGSKQDQELYKELFEIICEIVCVRHATVKVGGEEYPYEVVKSRFLKLNSIHLEYVIECMKNTTTKITNIKAYLVTALFNAPSTINHYYQQTVQHDMYGGGWAAKGITF